VSDAPPRDPREYALPWPAGAEPDAKGQHPTSTSRSWHGKARYGERARQPEGADAAARPPRRRRPRRLGTWMGA
jgi:hypothetical protein